MVVATANVKHMKKVKQENDEREEKLARWNAEKQGRKERLKTGNIR